jgi:hypothetical protein
MPDRGLSGGEPPVVGMSPSRARHEVTAPRQNPANMDAGPAPNALGVLAAPLRAGWGCLRPPAAFRSRVEADHGVKGSGVTTAVVWRTREPRAQREASHWHVSAPGAIAHQVGRAVRLAAMMNLPRRPGWPGSGPHTRIRQQSPSRPHRTSSTMNQHPLRRRTSDGRSFRPNVSLPSGLDMRRLIVNIHLPGTTDRRAGVV